MTLKFGHAYPCRAADALRNERSKGALWATKTVDLSLPLKESKTLMCVNEFLEASRRQKRPLIAEQLLLFYRTGLI